MKQDLIKKTNKRQT